MANMTVDRIKQLLINEPNFNMHQLKSMLLGKQTNTKYSNISDYELKINDNQQYARLTAIRIRGLNMVVHKVVHMVVHTVAQMVFKKVEVIVVLPDGV